MIQVRPDLAALFPEPDVAGFLAIETRVIRAKAHRSTGRFERGGRGFYIKKHRASGWWAILDDLLHLRRPHVGARPEHEAIRACERLGVPTMAVAAFGEEGRGASSRSFIVTEEVFAGRGVKLSHLCKDWPTAPPAHDVKRKLIDAVARIARTLHAGGVNHRDFYAGHFMLDPDTLDEPVLCVIDLHRAQVRGRTPRRWVVKDLAGLWFSSMDFGLTRRDLLRFIARYGRNDAGFWRDVDRRARAMYRKQHGRPAAE